MQLQGSEILTFFHSYQFNYSYHGSKVLVLGKGQQEICKTEFNFDAAHMQNKKINKKHILHNKESLFGVRTLKPFMPIPFRASQGWGEGGVGDSTSRCLSHRAKGMGLKSGPTELS